MGQAYLHILLTGTLDILLQSDAAFNQCNRLEYDGTPHLRHLCLGKCEIINHKL